MSCQVGQSVHETLYPRGTWNPPILGNVEEGREKKHNQCLGFRCVTKGAAAYRATLRHILSSICRLLHAFQQGNQQTSRDYHFVIPTHACVGSKEYSHWQMGLAKKHGYRREPPGGA